MEGIDCTYQVELMRALVSLTNQDFNNKDGADHEPQDNCGKKYKGKLKELPTNLLPLGKVMLCSAVLVNQDPFILERGPVDLDLVDAPYHPANAKVNLLHLPVLQKHGAPYACQYCKCKRVFWKKLPGKQACHGWERQEHEVCLNKGEIKRNLGAVQISDLVKVVNSQNDTLTQVAKDGLVLGLVVEGKHGLDIFPFAHSGGDSGTSQFLWPENDMV